MVTWLVYTELHRKLVQNITPLRQSGATLHDFISRKFKNKRDASMVLEVSISVYSGKEEGGEGGALRMSYLLTQEVTYTQAAH